jgi:hypothetical protein
MTHEPEHTRMGTIKSEFGQSKESGDPASSEPLADSKSESIAGDDVGESGSGDPGDDVDVVGGLDGSRCEWAEWAEWAEWGFGFPGGDVREQFSESSGFDFGIDGDFGCTRPAGLDGFWESDDNPARNAVDKTAGIASEQPIAGSKVERDDCGDDSADSVTSAEAAEAPDQVGGRSGPGSGDRVVQGPGSIAEVLWEGGSECESEETRLLDPGPVSRPVRDIDTPT